MLAFMNTNLHQEEGEGEEEGKQQGKGSRLQFDGGSLKHTCTTCIPIAAVCAHPLDGLGAIGPTRDMTGGWTSATGEFGAPRVIVAMRGGHRSVIETCK